VLAGGSCPYTVVLIHKDPSGTKITCVLLDIFCGIFHWSGTMNAALHYNFSKTAWRLI